MIDNAALDGSGFAVELRRWMEIRGASRTGLAKALNYSRSYVSKVAGGAEPGSATFARKADDVLRAGGAIRQAWNDQHSHAPATPTSIPADTGQGLVVDQDHAELFYDNGAYRLTQRRRLVNHGSEPVTRYLIRIAVDRYPGEPERSNRHYRENPLTWDEIRLRAWHGETGEEPMAWTVQHDRDAFKEVWLEFGNNTSRFPLYPDSACWIEYTYTVGDDKWGNWFRRAVRHATSNLSVKLDFPTALDPAVWGLRTTMGGGDRPFPTAIQRTENGGRTAFTWATGSPELHDRYKLEWTFRNVSAEAASPVSPSETMASLGIVQDGEEILRRSAKPFELPAEAEDAQRVIDDLIASCDRVSKAHTFGKGMGIAAPHIGIGRAAAITYPPGDPNPIVLFNPRIVETAGGTDDQYEGCLSFFDVRCRIPRARTVHVEHVGLDGRAVITVFHDGIARLVAHEVDHLHGVLCKDHLPPGALPTPVAEYRGTGSRWNYRA